MIKKRLVSYREIEPNIEILTVLYSDLYYFLRVRISSEKVNREKFIPCEINITDLEEEPIFFHKFFNKCNEKFKCEGTEPGKKQMRVCTIFLKFSPETGGILHIELTEIESKTIDNLKMSQNRKEELNRIIDNYVKQDFENAINNICIFGEFITKELARKIKNQNVDFRNAINILNNHKMTEKTKINYNYLGSILYPIYYIRNQKLHPYGKIEFDENIAELIFNSLSRAIDYLSKNQIKI